MRTFDGSSVRFDFVPGDPDYSPILHKTGTGDGDRRLASVNAGDPGLYVGGGTINLQFSREIADPGAYQAIHQAALDAARAGTFDQTGFGPADPVQLVLTRLSSGDGGAGAPADGTVFLDLFRSGGEPHGLPENAAMAFLIPPYGPGYDDDAAFLTAVAASATNVVEVIGRYNAAVVARRYGPPAPERITDLRMCLFSGGAFRRTSVTSAQVAQANFTGLEAAIARDPSGLRLVEFENGQGEFNALR